MADVGVEPLIAEVHLEVGGVLVPEVDHALIGCGELGGVGVPLDELVDGGVKGVGDVSLSFDHAHELVESLGRAGIHGEGPAHGEEGGHLATESIRKVGHELRVLERAVTDEVGIAHREGVEGAALAEQRGEALLALAVLRLVVDGHGDGLITLVEHLALDDHVRIDDVARHGVGLGDAEHAGHDDLKVAGMVRVVRDFDALGLDRVGHPVLLGEDEDGTADGEPVLGLVGDRRPALRMDTSG